MLTVLDLFSGIGAFSLGLEAAGAKTIQFCEADSYCRDVLNRHWPDVPCHDDVRTLNLPEGYANVVCGGFPCQDVSLAGKRAGLAGANSGLYRELVRAVRMVRPKLTFVENVAALLGDGMGTVLGDLAEGGACVEWDCVPACAIGAPHERDRVWIVAHADGVWGLQPQGSEQDKRRRSGDGIEARTSDAANATSEPLWSGRQSWEQGRVDRRNKTQPPNAPSVGCGKRRARRPPDSFARVRDEARRNAADPYGARYAFRQGIGRDAWEEIKAAERGGIEDVAKPIWPDEPALSGMDDDAEDWAHRTKATGNTLIWYIPKLIADAAFAELAENP